MPTLSPRRSCQLRLIFTSRRLTNKRDLIRIQRDLEFQGNRCRSIARNSLPFDPRTGNFRMLIHYFHAFDVLTSPCNLFTSRFQRTTVSRRRAVFLHRQSQSVACTVSFPGKQFPLRTRLQLDVRFEAN